MGLLGKRVYGRYCLDTTNIHTKSSKTCRNLTLRVGGMVSEDVGGEEERERKREGLTDGRSFAAIGKVRTDKRLVVRNSFGKVDYHGSAHVSAVDAEKMLTGQS